MQRPLDVASVDRVTPGTALVVSYSMHPVAVFNIGGKLFALEDACLRCGASLAGGRIADMIVDCLRCGWRYHVASGSVEGIPALHVDTFEVRVARGRILLKPNPCRLR
jgi:nitrite reductase/ring-hydroxylating ferredoxin subunit